MSEIRDGGKYTLRNYAYDAKALNVINNGYIANGVNVTLWSKDGSDEQTWVANEVASGKFKLATAYNTNYVLDRHRITNNADVWENLSSEDIAQIVVFEEVDTDAYRIKLASTNLYLAAVDGSNGSSNGTSSSSSGNVYWTTSKSSSRTKWIVEEIGGSSNNDKHDPPSDGTYNIVASNGAHLNVYAGTDANGTKLCIWEADGSIDQEFKLDSYSSYSKIYAMCSSNGNGRVVDAYRPGNAVQDGTKAQIWDETDPTSHKIVISYKGNGYYKIALKSNNNLCLTAHGTANNSSVTFSRYTGAAGQLWSFDEVQPVEGIDAHNPPDEDYYNLICKNGAYLNVYDGGSANGTRVCMWAGDNSIEQQFELINNPQGSTLYAMCSNNGQDKVLDAYKPGKTVQNGTKAQIWEDTDPEAQVMFIIPEGGGYYKVVLESNPRLALTAAGSANNSNVTFSNYSGSQNQLWNFKSVERIKPDKHEPPADGTYNVIASNGAQLNVYAGTDANGTKLCIWEADGSIEQEFKLDNSSKYSKIYAMCSSNGNGRVVDAYRPGKAVQDGTKAQIWDETDPTSHQLVISKKENGYYKIALKSNNSLCLTAHGTANDFAVTFSKYTGAAGQLWSFDEVQPVEGIEAHNPPDEDYYNLICKNGAYLNVYAGGSANGTRVCMWAGDNSIEQQFELINNPQGSTLYAMCSNNGQDKVLDAYKPGKTVQNRTKAQIWEDTDPEAQVMFIIPEGGGYYKVVLESNPRLALTAAGSTNNSNVTFSNYFGSQNQLWKFNGTKFINTGKHKPPEEGVYNVTNKGNSLKLNVYAGADKDGTNVVCWSEDGSTEQKFRLSNEDGFSRLFAMCSSGGMGRVLDAFRKPSEAVQNGTKAQIWSPTDDKAQLLKIAPKKDGYYIIALKGDPKLVLTASGEAVGGKVTFSTYTGADTQLWKLDLIDKWKEPEFDPNIERQFTQNKTTGRNGTTAQAWVCHIAEGTLEGTIAWEKNPDSQVSSHFVIGKSGRIVQMVDVEDTAWCNGTRNDPNSSAYWGNATASIVAENAKNGFYNANEYTISIEFEGFYNQTKGRITNAQLEAAAWLMAYYKQEKGCTIPLDREHIIGHYQIAPVSRPNCPGQQFPFGELIARVHELAGGEVNPPTGNTGLDADKLYFIKKKGTEKYLTVLENKTDGIINPAADGNGFELNKKLEYEYAQKKPNPRQLFRILDNGMIRPACDSLGESSFSLQNKENKLILGRLLVYDQPDQTAALLMPTQNQGTFFIKSNNNGKDNIFSASNLQFTQKSTPAGDDMWTVQVFDRNEQKEIEFNGKKYQSYVYDREELTYSHTYYNKVILENDVRHTKYKKIDGKLIPEYFNKDINYIKVTEMPHLTDYYPNGYERFYPYSGMKNDTLLGDTHKIGIIKANDSTGNIVLDNIHFCIRTFYKHVYGFPQDSLRLEDNKLYSNLFGGYMPAGDQHGYHMGIDINDGTGRNIISAHKGIVVFTSYNWGTVAIYDPSYDVTYIYMHLLKGSIKLNIGDEVDIGTILGIEHHSGVSDVHLHFEVLKGCCKQIGNAPITAEQWNQYNVNTTLMPYQYMLIYI